MPDITCQDIFTVSVAITGQCTISLSDTDDFTFRGTGSIIGSVSKRFTYIAGQAPDDDHDDFGFSVNMRLPRGITLGRMQFRPENPDVRSATAMRSGSVFLSFVFNERDFRNANSGESATFNVSISLNTGTQEA